MRRRGILTAAAVAAGLVMAAGPAYACGERGDDCGDDGGGGATPTGGEGAITIRVWGTGVNAGTPGGFEIPASSVTVLPPCRFTPLWTGKEYYDGIESGAINGAGSSDHDAGTWQPNPGYKAHKDDTKGRWWVPFCTTEGWEGSFDEWTEIGEEWFDTQEDAFVVENGTPPVPPIPPEVLMEAAMDSMELPPPTISWNPKADGAQASLVNLDTWLWLDGSPRTLEVHAAAGGNEASVRAVVDSMTASAPDAGSVTCAGTGVPWSPGAASSCTLAFRRANAATPVSVQTNWGLSWSANGVPQGALDPMSMTGVNEIPVIESQSVVTDIG